MALEDYVLDMMRCEKDSICKFVPLMMHNTKEFSEVCPSVMRFNFHSYSGSGRLFAALGFLRGRTDYTEGMTDLVYNCQMCGACDITCKAVRDIELLETLIEWRVRMVEDGQVPLELMMVIDGLKAEDNMLGQKKADRGKWAEGLGVKDLAKEKAEVAFHAGCRYSFDEELWPTARKALELLLKAGEDVGILGKQENCCGGRAYEMGFEGEFRKYMDSNLQDWNNAGVKKVVTPCSDCYATTKAWYSRYGNKVEIVHITEYLESLIKEGKLKLKKEVPMKVTYHDPCHLGRLSEPYEYSAPGKPYISEEISPPKVRNVVCVYDPPKEWRRGSKGIYDPPREVIKSIPGLEFIEMERIKSWSYCCGAGGGVIDSNPDYARWTADKRLDEAQFTGADALVTACPWCVRNFSDALSTNGRKIEVLDVIELVGRSVK
jgi:heterodisulfide reductase subunit D